MLELKNITKSFGDAPRAERHQPDLGQGRIMSILGPSGGGKTTLLNIILGITDATGGQKQRVALARTLVMKPRLLLLDEPLSALDGVIKESIKAKIKQIVDQYNLTTIMVTHDPEEACTMSDRVLILNQGRIAQYDTPENIIEHPASDFVRDFILHQLEVKRNNIYSLFSEDHAADPADPRPPRTGARRRRRGVIHHVGRIHPGGQAAAQHRPRDHQP
ncbi:ABC spermidine/putrescine transporter [Bifidobacterium pullorum]|uniref:ABC spermidine/putrescine transporter n=1 Tax=Bifidobacterium pullorum TaxID=78448 RepID=A0A7V8HQR4_9BIFI|nr:ABC spermidine/putrescine transporter [Bifidobacterium pullorum]